MNTTSLIQAARGPVVLITLGVLFIVHQNTQFNFERTFPALLIVFGLMKLAERFVEGDQPEPFAPGYPAAPGYPPASSVGTFPTSPYQPYQAPPGTVPGAGSVGHNPPAAGYAPSPTAPTEVKRADDGSHDPMDDQTDNKPLGGGQ